MTSLAPNSGNLHYLTNIFKLKVVDLKILTVERDKTENNPTQTEPKCEETKCINILSGSSFEFAHAT